MLEDLPKDVIEGGSEAFYLRLREQCAPVAYVDLDQLVACGDINGDIIFCRIYAL